MDVVLPVLFATIAAIGNAVFALGQKQSAGAANGLLFVAASAGLAMLAALVCAPLTGGLNRLTSQYWPADRPGQLR